MMRRLWTRKLSWSIESGHCCFQRQNRVKDSSFCIMQRCILALALGAPPDEATAKIVAQNLANDVMQFRNKTTTGVVGIGFLFPQLDKYGYGELALSTLVQDECKLRTSRLPARRSYVWRWSQTLRSATWLTRT